MANPHQRQHTSLHLPCSTRTWQQPGKSPVNTPDAVTCGVSAALCYTMHHAGPAISASGKRTWPGNSTPVPGLTVCGDSCMPGIGVPAAAASGMMAANSLAPVWDHLKVLNELAL